MPREWLNLVLPDRPNALSVTDLVVAVVFFVLVPVGCFLGVLASLLLGGWL